ncbi:Diacylglycerol kinase family enzyme [Leucobacter chromiiresistens]|uniref:Diacylglycerol kinase family enzyme n=2 Tax=Leucobacter chromiiresistens TaxID=1079994 RepID=A0A1H0YKI2_9MICO|nr:Diacylglycerol kinase family enzyme [Leucobacter chromiiresistens]
MRADADRCGEGFRLRPQTSYDEQMSESRQRTAAVIYNPIKVDVDVLRKEITRAAVEAEWAEPLWLETTAEDAGQGMTEEAKRAGVDLVIAAGGDGTVRAVAEGLRGSEIPLALLPSGTGNLLARNLDLTLNDMPGSVTSAFTGTNRPIDLGVIDLEREGGARERHVFVVMAGMGIDAKMIKNTDDDLKKRAGWLAYLGAIVKSLRDPNELHFRYSLDDGRTKRATAHTVIIGNCGSLPANILLLPEAVIDDGQFDILLIRPGNVFGWLRVWAKIAWVNGIMRRTKSGRALVGEQKDDGDLKYRTGKRFVARLTRPEEIELDGDGFGKAVAFNAWIEPGALTVRVPADDR